MPNSSIAPALIYIIGCILVASGFVAIAYEMLSKWRWKRRQQRRLYKTGNMYSRDYK